MSCQNLYENITLEELEILLLDVADRNKKETQRFLRLLDAHQKKEIPLPPPFKQCIAENLRLIIGDIDDGSKRYDIQQIIFALAALDIDIPSLRNGFAQSIRQLHASYPNFPALIESLGLFDNNFSIQEIAKRWNIFSVLKAEGLVWHSAYSLGKITNIDALSNLISVDFLEQKRKQTFTLKQCFKYLSIIQEKEFLASLEMGDTQFSVQDISPEQVDKGIAICSLPALKNIEQIREAFLVPHFITQKKYESWKTKETQPMASNSAITRTWRNARSLVELRNGISNIKEKMVIRDQRDKENIITLFSREAEKALSRFSFSECLSLLWSANQTFLQEILLPPLSGKAFPWSSYGVFVEVTGKLSAKHAQHWLTLTEKAKGREWLIEAILNLPLKYWPMTKHPLLAMPGFSADLESAVRESLMKEKAHAESVVWLWKNRRKQEGFSFENISGIFRVLSKPVKGDYLRAYKELRKLLFDNTDFQTVLMDHGTDKGIKQFVTAIKQMSTWGKGEKQSLLVKIVRIFPQAQPFVEERKKVIARKPIAKMTSCRSFQNRQKELELIIQDKIPKNSATIAHARSYGDLRENAEYKAAKEEQRMLMQRRGELEKDIKEIKATDFSDVQVGRIVIPGCSVTVHTEGKDPEVYHILGLWDSDPEENIISYDSPLGRSLIGKKIGETMMTPQKQKTSIVALESLPSSIQDDIGYQA